MSEHNKIACPECGAELKVSEKFCAACGSQLQKVKEHVPETEEQFIESLAVVDLDDPSQCESAWNESLAYLKRYPKGKFEFDVLVTAEIAKAALAMHRMKAYGGPDYSLYDMQSPVLNDIFEHVPDPLPKETRTGFHIKPLSEAELKALASRTGVKATGKDLVRGFVTYQLGMISLTAGPIARMKEAVTDKYQKKLVNGKSKAQLQGLSSNDIWDRADVGYAAYENSDFQGAVDCFRDLAEIDPFEHYHHNLLYASYEGLREHKQALEEILYASSLAPSDIQIQLNLAVTFRRLGLYVETVRFFVYGDEVRIPEELDQNDLERSESIYRIWNERELAIMVFSALMSYFFSNALRTNQWQEIWNGVTTLEIKQKEKEERLKQSLEGTNLFISYRRSDSGDQVDCLCELLQERLPDVDIFRDISNMSPGEGWLEKLERAIKKADVVLAIIGTGWAGRDESGGSRLDDRNDVLRRELALALRQNVKIIPVLVNDASMPKSRELPSELRAIARTQAIALKPSSFNQDAEELVSELREILKPSAEEYRMVEESIDEAIKGDYELEFSDNILFSDFNQFGRWECKIKAPEAKGKLLFAIKHDWSFKGIWEPAGEVRIPVQGNVMVHEADDNVTLRGLRLEGITEDADPFAVYIPIDKKVGEGYQGTDESGGSYFLRLIERTKEGL